MGGILGGITQRVGNLLGGLIWPRRGGNTGAPSGHTPAVPVILKGGLVPVGSNQHGSPGTQSPASNLSTKEILTMATVVEPLSIISDDLIKFVEAAVQAYTTGSATYTPDPVSVPIAGKTATFSPVVGITFK